MDSRYPLRALNNGSNVSLFKPFRHNCYPVLEGFLIDISGGAMGENKVLCAVCAWRATCQKQFSMKAGQKCAEFVKDVTIKEEKEDKEKDSKMA